MKTFLIDLKMENGIIQKSITACMALYLDFFVTAHQDRFDLMCILNTYDKIHENVSD